MLVSQVCPVPETGPRLCLASFRRRREAGICRVSVSLCLGGSVLSDPQRVCGSVCHWERVWTGDRGRGLAGRPCVQGAPQSVPGSLLCEPVPSGRV